MSKVEKTPPTLGDMTECTEAHALAEAAATLAAQAAARAEAARAKAEEARARAEAIRAGTTTNLLRAPEGPPAPPPPDTTPESIDLPASTVEQTESPIPEAVSSDTATAPAPEDPTSADRRSGIDRRVSTTDTRTDSAAPERRTGPRRQVHRDTDLTDNSGIIRLGDAVRAAVSAQSADRRALRTDAPTAEPGQPLEPLAHSAGLHPHRRKRRHIFSPGLFLLVGLMTLFGLYATGNLPQFDRWTDAAVHSTQAHNAEVVGTVVNSWRLIAGSAAAVCLLLIILLIVNAIRARSTATD